MKEGESVKVKATKRYVDKFTKKIIESGTVLNNVSEERAKELAAEGAVEIIEEKSNKSVKERAGDET